MTGFRCHAVAETFRASNCSNLCRKLCHGVGDRSHKSTVAATNICCWKVRVSSSKCIHGCKYSLCDHYFRSCKFRRKFCSLGSRHCNDKTARLIARIHVYTCKKPDQRLWCHQSLFSMLIRPQILYKLWFCRCKIHIVALRKVVAPKCTFVALPACTLQRQKMWHCNAWIVTATASENAETSNVNSDQRVCSNKPMTLWPLGLQTEAQRQDDNNRTVSSPASSWQFKRKWQEEGIDQGRGSQGRGWSRGWGLDEGKTVLAKRFASLRVLWTEKTSIYFCFVSFEI